MNPQYLHLLASSPDWSTSILHAARADVAGNGGKRLEVVFADGTSDLLSWDEVRHLRNLLVIVLVGYTWRSVDPHLEKLEKQRNWKGEDWIKCIERGRLDPDRELAKDNIRINDGRPGSPFYWLASMQEELMRQIYDELVGPVADQAIRFWTHTPGASTLWRNWVGVTDTYVQERERQDRNSHRAPLRNTIRTKTSPENIARDMFKQIMRENTGDAITYMTWATTAALIKPGSARTYRYLDKYGFSDEGFRRICDASRDLMETGLHLYHTDHHHFINVEDGEWLKQSQVTWNDELDCPMVVWDGKASDENLALTGKCPANSYLLDDPERTLTFTSTHDEFEFDFNAIFDYPRNTALRLSNGYLQALSQRSELRHDLDDQGMSSTVSRAHLQTGTPDFYPQTD